MKRLMRHTRGVGFALLLLGMFALVAAVAVPVTASADEGGGGDTVVVLMDQPTNPGNSENAPGQNKEEATKPGGNNGVLKVDGQPVDDANPLDNKEARAQGHRDNEPHVGCVFNLDWYGFEQGTGVSTVEFQLWGPNKEYALNYTEESASVGGDAQGNASDQDATKTYDLTNALAAADAAGATPNDQQGWLLKVTVRTDGLSQGADMKHKVFWVDECQGGSSTTRGDGGHDVLLTLGEVITTTTTTEAPTTTVEVAPLILAPTTTQPAEVLGVSLARTGAMTTALLLVAGLSLAMGGALLFATKEPEQA